MRNDSEIPAITGYGAISAAIEDLTEFCVGKSQGADSSERTSEARREEKGPRTMALFLGHGLEVRRIDQRADRISTR